MAGNRWFDRLNGLFRAGAQNQSGSERVDDEPIPYRLADEHGDDGEASEARQSVASEVDSAFTPADHVALDKSARLDALLARYGALNLDDRDGDRIELSEAIEAGDSDRARAIRDRILDDAADTADTADPAVSDGAGGVDEAGDVGPVDQVGTPRPTRYGVLSLDDRDIERTELREAIEDGDLDRANYIHNYIVGRAEIDELTDSVGESLTADDPLDYDPRDYGDNDDSYYDRAADGPRYEPPDLDEPDPAVFATAVAAADRGDEQEMRRLLNLSQPEPVEAWTQQRDATRWSPDTLDSWDPVIDIPAEDIDPPRAWFDPQRSWTDPVNPVAGLLESEAWIVDVREDVFSALTGLDPAEHDTREIGRIIRSDGWPDEWHLDDLRDYHSRRDTPSAENWDGLDQAAARELAPGAVAESATDGRGVRGPDDLLVADADLGAAVDALITDTLGEAHPGAADASSRSQADDTDRAWDVAEALGRHPELDSVDAAVRELGDEPVTEESLGSVGVTREQYDALLAEQAEIQARGAGDTQAVVDEAVGSVDAACESAGTQELVDRAVGQSLDCCHQPPAHAERDAETERARQLNQWQTEDSATDGRAACDGDADEAGGL